MYSVLLTAWNFAASWCTRKWRRWCCVQARSHAHMYYKKYNFMLTQIVFGAWSKIQCIKPRIIWEELVVLWNDDNHYMDIMQILISRFYRISINAQTLLWKQFHICTFWIFIQSPDTGKFTYAFHGLIPILTLVDQIYCNHKEMWFNKDDRTTHPIPHIFVNLIVNDYISTTVNDDDFEYSVLYRRTADIHSKTRAN